MKIILVFRGNSPLINGFAFLCIFSFIWCISTVCNMISPKLAPNAIQTRYIPWQCCCMNIMVHQTTDNSTVCSTCSSQQQQQKFKALNYWPFVWKPLATGGFSSQRPVMWKESPCHDIIMCTGDSNLASWVWHGNCTVVYSSFHPIYACIYHHEILH